jgi:putative ABC transport system permease protein
MFKTFFKIAIRNLVKNKQYTVINIVGLSVALACCIVAYLNYEFSYGFDAFHQNAEKIFRVNSIKVVNGKEQKWGTTPAPLAPAIQKDIPGVARAVRVSRAAAVFRYGDKVFNETVYYVDNAFFEMFTFPFKLGSPQVLQDKNSLVLSAELAAKYFGDENPLGKQITLRSGDGNIHEFLVGGVVQKLPANSSIQFDALVSYDRLMEMGHVDVTSWGNWALVTFIQVFDPAQVSNIQKQLENYIAVQNAARPDWMIAKYYLEPLREMALQSQNMRNYVFNQGVHPANIVAPAITAVLLLLMACFNFMNTSVAFSAKRLKEIGVRRVMGAWRAQLIWQFLCENFLLCTIALIVALGLAEIFVPAYSHLWTYIDMDLRLSYHENFGLLAFIAILLFSTAILAGAYPAYYISRYNPVNIMRGKQKIGGTNRFMRFLMTFQLANSIMAIITGVVFARNANYQANFDLGYALNEVIVVPLNKADDFMIFSNAIKQYPDIISVAGTRNHPSFGRQLRQASHESITAEVNLFEIGDHYLEAAGLRLNAGRDFDPSLETDLQNAVIVNKTLMHEFGWNDAIGKQITIDSVRYGVIGAVEDFHEDGLWSLVAPCVLRLSSPERFNFLIVRTSPKHLVDVNALLKTQWQQLFPDTPYEGIYQEEVMATARQVNGSIKTVSLYIALIAIVITMMGLFALVSLNVARRTKEIGIRKVLGASVLSVGNLIGKEFVVLLVIASALASVGGFFESKFLLDSIWAYHIGMEMFPFVVSILLAFLVAALTIGSQVYKVATANPVEALRYE